jgi:hypothetical protein
VEFLWEARFRQKSIVASAAWELIPIRTKPIYNTYTVQLDIGELRGGQNLGKIKEIIDSYADAEQNYEDYLKEKWAKIAIMNDGERWLRALRMQIGGPR